MFSVLFPARTWRLWRLGPPLSASRFGSGAPAITDSFRLYGARDPTILASFHGGVPKLNFAVNLFLRLASRDFPLSHDEIPPCFSSHELSQVYFRAFAICFCRFLACWPAPNAPRANKNEEAPRGVALRRRKAPLGLYPSSLRRTARVLWPFGIGNGSKHPALASRAAARSTGLAAVRAILYATRAEPRPPPTAPMVLGPRRRWRADAADRRARGVGLIRILAMIPDWLSKLSLTRAQRSDAKREEERH